MLVVDIQHWLAEQGSLPLEPASLRRKAVRVAQLIEYGAPLEAGQSRETLVTCTKRPNRKPCLGFLWVVKEPDRTIYACCSTCRRDEVLISGWQETQWAEGMMQPVPVGSPELDLDWGDTPPTQH